MQTCLCMCSVFVCVLWWHLLAKASLLWLPAWPYQIYTWTCLLSMHMTPRGGNQTSDSEPSLLSSSYGTMIFHKYDAFLHEEGQISSSAEMVDISEAFHHPNRYRFFFFFKKVIYSVSWNAAALAERSWVAAEQESRVWLQIWGTSYAELLGMH